MATGTGQAPYLDYTPSNDEQKDLVRAALKESWGTSDHDDVAVSWAIQNSLPQHLEEIQGQIIPAVERARTRVRQRLTAEINYQDSEHAKLLDLEAAGKDAVGLFYFAGHGVQVKGSNYLMPVNVEINDEADVDIEAVSAAAIQDQMRYAGNRLNLIVMDACRNNPFIVDYHRFMKLKTPIFFLQFCKLSCYSGVNIP
ncbi:MAG: hypothetical protein EBS24_03865 [Chitinophagia bacterium]|nr:hypothetical protein [Chitinophagia bacterium]